MLRHCFPPKTQFEIRALEKSARDMDILAELNRDSALARMVTGFFKDRILHKMFETGCACLYHDTGSSHVIKVFHDSPRSHGLFEREVKTYVELQDIPNTAKMVAKASRKVKAIVMKHLGTDGLEICNRGGLKHDHWKSMILTGVTVLDNLHARGRYHGDVKLENMTFDGSEWHFIDFGFSSASDLDPLEGFFGTTPFVLPDYGMVTGRPTPSRVLSDWYAFALSALSAAGIHPDDVCEVCMHSDYRCTYGRHLGQRRGTRIDLDLLIDIHKDVNCVSWQKRGGELRNSIELVTELVLSQLDTRRKYLVWLGTKCHYSGYTEGAPEGFRMRCHSVEEVWDRLRNSVVL